MPFKDISFNELVTGKNYIIEKICPGNNIKEYFEGRHISNEDQKAIFHHVKSLINEPLRVTSTLHKFYLINNDVDESIEGKLDISGNFLQNRTTYLIERIDPRPMLYRAKFVEKKENSNVFVFDDYVKLGNVEFIVTSGDDITARFFEHIPIPTTEPTPQEYYCSTKQTRTRSGGKKRYNQKLQRTRIKKKRKIKKTLRQRRVTRPYKQVL